MGLLISIIKLLRPAQWIKNFFVVAPLFFGGRLLDVECWREAFIAFISFSLMASSIYCLNDVVDVDADRRHPRKRFRPVASGDIAPAMAYALMGFLIILALAIPVLWLRAHTLEVVAILIAYLILNVAYCLWLKRLPIVDVFIIATGFVLRLVCGGVACDIWLSPWIVSMTFLLALFLAFAKRRDDVLIYDRTGVAPRKNVIRYNLPFMDQTLGIIGSVTMVCYVMFTMSSDVEARLGSSYLYITSVFVLAGILRYLQASLVDMNSGSPTRLLMHDRFIQACVICWIAAFAIIIYL